MSASDDALVKAWASAYSSEVLSFARPEEVSNEEVFADVYHSLIHSAGLSATLLQLRLVQGWADLVVAGALSRLDLATHCLSCGSTWTGR